jgi:hypothetical protein
LWCIAKAAIERSIATGILRRAGFRNSASWPTASTPGKRRVSVTLSPTVLEPKMDSAIAGTRI